jgi:hypothetical protein
VIGQVPTQIKDIMVRLDTPRIYIGDYRIVFTHATKQAEERIQEILKVYNKVSGQFLNKKN